jgi:hypothetical protein
MPLARRRDQAQRSFKERTTMPTIYLSENGDDKNDGLTEITPIHSWERYLQLKTGNDKITIMGDPQKTIARLRREIKGKKPK